MRTRQLSALALVLGALIGLGLYSISSVRATKQEPVKKDLIKKVPEIKSCVSTIEVLKAEIKDQIVEVEVKNIGEIGMTAIALTSAKGREAHTNSLSADFDESKTPIIVLQPEMTTILKMEVANIFKGFPLTISAVMYADGTDEGCTTSLQTLRKLKANDEARARGEHPQ